MNDNLFNNDNFNMNSLPGTIGYNTATDTAATEEEQTTENHTEANNVTNTTSAESTSGTTPPVVSAPYRYKYENGEKTEIPNHSYDTYNYTNNPYSNNTASYTYGTASSAARTTSSATESTPKKKKPFLKAVKWLAGAACFGIIAGAAFMGTTYFASEVLGIELMQVQAKGNTGGTTSGGNAASGTGIPLNITLGSTSTIAGVENPAESVVVQVVEENMAATVAVKSTFLKTYSYWGQQYSQEQQGSGSGFIVGKNDTELLIATNNHVIADATKIEITFIDDTVLEATIKGTDSVADLAIIAVSLDSISADTLSKIRVATLGDSEAVRLGEMAIAIGNALGYGQSVTVGYISAKDRTVTVDGNEMVLLQTDAAINGGNSGGPLFNTKGEVIGINSVKYADTSVEGMCFAIPISRAIPILNELMNRETLSEEDKGFLGVSTRTVTDDIATFYGWPIGAYIVSILENSPAEAAGLYIGDIVTSVNGVKITTADQLVAAIASYRHGTTVEMIVQRNVNGKYEEITISATLGKKAEVEAAAENSKKEITESGSSENTEDSNDSGSSSSSGNSRKPGNSSGRN